MSIDWSLFRSPDIGQAFTAGVEQGRERKRVALVQNALAGFAHNPDDPNAVSQLMALDQGAGMRAAEYQRQRTSTQRDEKFRGALSGFLASDQQQPNALRPGVSPPSASALSGYAPAPAAGDLDRYMPGLTGAPVGASAPRNSLVGNEGAAPAVPGTMSMPSAAAPAVGGQRMESDISPEHLEALDQHHAAWREMVAADPVKAMEFRRQQYTDLKGRLDVMQGAYSFAIGKLANVTNEQDYQDVLDTAGDMFAEVGVNVRDFAPANYPGPQGIRQLLNSAMDAKDQVIALDRRAKLDWDMQDDEADNTRADRNVDSAIANRDERLSLSRTRETRIASKPTRGSGGGGRGERSPTLSGTMAPILAKVSRGESLTTGEQRAWSMYRPGPGGKSLPTIRTPDEARRLPSGTRFKTPDGKTKVVP